MTRRSIRGRAIDRRLPSRITLRPGRYTSRQRLGRRCPDAQRRRIDVAHVHAERASGCTRPPSGALARKRETSPAPGLPRQADADVTGYTSPDEARRPRAPRCRDRRADRRGHIIQIVYSVTKRTIAMGHWLLDYDGICAPARPQPRWRSRSVPDRRQPNMVCDFSDIADQRLIDAQLDHKMPLPRRSAGRAAAGARRAGVSHRQQPHGERIAKLIYDKATEHGLPVVRVTVWETPTSFAEFRS